MPGASYAHDWPPRPVLRGSQHTHRAGCPRFRFFIFISAPTKFQPGGRKPNRASLNITKKKKCRPSHAPREACQVRSDSGIDAGSTASLCSNNECHVSAVNVKPSRLGVAVGCDCSWLGQHLRRGCHASHGLLGSCLVLPQLVYADWHLDGFPGETSFFSDHQSSAEYHLRPYHLRQLSTISDLFFCTNQSFHHASYCPIWAADGSTPYMYW